MALLIAFLALILLIPVVVLYWEWRQKHRDDALRFEQNVKRLSVKAARASAQGAATAASAAADLVREKVEAARLAKLPMRWCDQEQLVTVHEFTLARPLTYVGKPQPGRTESSCLDLSLRVEKPKSGPLERLPYWPSYAHMTPHQRYVYLKWMADGRRTMPPEIGYAFVFFYGLERRALVEREDSTQVAREVLRLRRMHARSEDAFSHSFEQYTSLFLWLLIVSASDSFDEQVVREVMLSVKSWNDDKLGAALAWFVLQEKPLPYWAAYILAGELPRSQRSVVVSRVGNEFRTLFKKRYQEKFGDGMALTSAARDKRITYKTASAAIGVVEATVPNPLGRSGQFKVLSDIWNQTIADLRRLSSVVGRQSDEELTVAAWEALPPELRAGIDHPLTGAFCDLIERHTNEDGHTLLRVGDVATVLGFEPRDRLTPSQSAKLAETAEAIGYGIEPDSRITGKSYRADDLVAAFLRVTDETLHSGRYNAASCMLRLGLGVAAADGHIHPDELTLVTQEVERWFQLNDGEQRRLEALRALLLRTGPDLKALAPLTKALKPNQREAIGKLLLALIAEDGVITNDEIRAVRKCYRTLGLDENDVDKALAAFTSPDDDEPVTVRPAAEIEDKGEPIPARIRPRQEGLRLDRSAIAALLKETDEVAQMLAQAMAESDTEDDASARDGERGVSVASMTRTVVSVAPAEVQTANEHGPPDRFRPLYDVLIEKEEWALVEVQGLAREHGLMAAGAIEAINEWSFEALGGQLIVEDGDALLIERDLLT